MPTDISNPEEFQAILAKNKYVVVDFYADWCPPCKAIAPMYANLAKENDAEGVLSLIKVNVDNVPEVGQMYNVTAMPTFMFFADGKPAGVPVDVTSQATVRGPDGVSLIRGADPRSLTACVAKLAELGKKAADANTTVSGAYSIGSSAGAGKRADWKMSLKA